MFKKLLAVLALVILIPNSGATQTNLDDPISEIAEWFPVDPSYSCTVSDPRVYVHGLEYFFGQTELFIAETILTIYNHDDSEYHALEGTMVFFVNQDTTTYTMAVLTNEGMLCEILHGWNFMPYSR